ncbi:MAG: hypothetical protein GXO79_12525 [Chlorobi bacterium]|nr:hypothetical protein [Chlorobiota bacterium]
MIIENQTIIAPKKGNLQFTIHHRMGKMNNGISDLFGIYAASNIRLGLNYGITDKLMVGFGTEKSNKMQEFMWKYAILQQTKSGSMPVSISYFGNFVINANEKMTFGKDYAFSDRLSYFNEVIIARKFNKKLSAQITAGFAHINAVDSVWQNQKANISFGGRYRVYNDISILAEYGLPVTVSDLESYQNEVEPNYAFGMEIATGTHTFQIFATTYNNIIAQKNIIYNMNELNSKGLSIGFNITVRF